MNYNFGNIIFPQDFKYLEVVRKGKPLHKENDSFYLKHPPMDLSRNYTVITNNTREFERVPNLNIEDWTV